MHHTLFFNTYTTYVRWRSTLCSVTHCTRSIFHTRNIWQMMLHTMLCYTLHLFIFYTHSIWQVTIHTMLYAPHYPIYTHTIYERWRSVPCCIRVPCTTPSIFHPHTTYGRWRFTSCSITNCTRFIFHTHNIWQMMLHTIFYHTLHLIQLLYTQHMAGDAPHHALWKYHAPHPPFSAHTTNGRWRYTPCSITRWNPFIFHTHSIWQLTIHTMLYKSIMHQREKSKRKEKEKKLEIKIKK